MIRTEKRLRLCIALLCGVLTFIWGNSLLPAPVSQALSDWVKAVLFGPPSGNAAGSGSGLLRKIAHFTEFCALGMCLAWLHGMLRKKTLLSLMWGLCAACVDETIQCFVPNRGPGIPDILLDTAGVAVGIGMIMAGYHILRKRKQHLLLEENKS